MIANGLYVSEVTANNIVGGYTDIIINRDTACLSIRVNGGKEEICCLDEDLKLDDYALYPTVFLNSKNVSVGFEDPPEVEFCTPKELLLKSKIKELAEELLATKNELYETRNALEGVEEELEDTIESNDEEIE